MHTFYSLYTHSSSVDLSKLLLSKWTPIYFTHSWCKNPVIIYKLPQIMFSNQNVMPRNVLDHTWCGHLWSDLWKCSYLYSLLTWMPLIPATWHFLHFKFVSNKLTCVAYASCISCCLTFLKIQSLQVNMITLINMWHVIATGSCKLKQSIKFKKLDYWLVLFNCLIFLSCCCVRCSLFFDYSIFFI